MPSGLFFGLGTLHRWEQKTVTRLLAGKPEPKNRHSSPLRPRHSSAGLPERIPPLRHRRTGKPAGRHEKRRLASSSLQSTAFPAFPHPSPDCAAHMILLLRTGGRLAAAPSQTARPRLLRRHPQLPDVCGGSLETPVAHPHSRFIPSLVEEEWLGLGQLSAMHGKGKLFPLSARTPSSLSPTLLLVPPGLFPSCDLWETW